MRIGILTGGGDAPGLNGVIESVTKNLAQHGIESIGIQDGFEGVYEENTILLDTPFVDGIHQKAGTIIGTSNKRGINNPEEFLDKFNRLRLDGLIAAGGDGTFKALAPLAGKINIIGIPKTIDNDLAGTEITFGHHSASALIARSISSLKNSADAHKRIMVVETMGRTAGWLALNGGLAGYADAILIPEHELNVQVLINSLTKKLSSGKRGLVVAISEGVKIEGQEIIKKVVSDSPEAIRLGGVSSIMADLLEKEIGIESRNVVLGHLQRSEPPEVFDKLFTLKLGCEAAKLVKKGIWNKGLAFSRGGAIPVELSEFCASPRLVPKECDLVDYARSLDIFV